MVQQMSNGLRLEKEGKVVNSSSKNNSSSGSGNYITFSSPGDTVGKTSNNSTSGTSNSGISIKGPDGTVKSINLSPPKTINSSGGGTSGGIEFTRGDPNNSAVGSYMQNGARNAAVDSAALNKQGYTPEDAKTYANRETAYTFVDKITGKVNTIYSNYTNYKDAARAAGYDLSQEGITWSMPTSTTYGISGSSGRGTAYGATNGGYNSENSASGGWYGEAMRRVNNAQNQYGGLDNIVNRNAETYKAYMQGNYLPIYGMDPGSINWGDVASGRTAQEYWDAGRPAGQQEYNPNSYYESLMSGLAYTPQELGYQAPTGGYADILQNNADRITALAAPVYNPVDAAQWNYDVPETVRMQNAGYQMTPAAEAYSGMLESANTDADIAMAKYWSDIAASARSENDRQYALRQALRYRNKIA